MRLPDFRIVVVALFVVASCNSEKKQTMLGNYSDLLAALFQSDEGLFRGIELGMTQADVKTHLDPKKITEEAADYLLIEDSLSNNRHYTFDCTFDEKGLREIRTDVFLYDQENADSLFAEVKNYFTKKYGAPAQARDGFFWLVDHPKRPAKIALVDETDFYMYGKLSITFFDREIDPELDPRDSFPVNDSTLAF